MKTFGDNSRVEINNAPDLALPIDDSYIVLVESLSEIQYNSLKQNKVIRYLKIKQNRQNETTWEIIKKCIRHIPSTNLKRLEIFTDKILLEDFEHICDSLHFPRT